MTEVQHFLVRVTQPVGSDPITLRLHADGSIETPRGQRVPMGEVWQDRGLEVRVGADVSASGQAWSGPELLVLQREGERTSRMRCPLPAAGGSTVVVGRSQRVCDVVVTDEHVSRVHLKITADAEGHTVEDLQSKWGTLINGKPLHERTRLSHGDELSVGTSVIRYLIRWDDAISAAMPQTAVTSAGFGDAGETQVSAPSSEHMRPERLPSRAGGTVEVRSAVVRPTVAPTWIGIGIGLMMALVGMAIYTLVMLWWPEA